MHFGDMATIVVERYDRVFRDNLQWPIRVHQEDFCQALNHHPSRKYEQDGGPGIKAICGILDSSAAPAFDKREFLRASFLNLLIDSADAHAKNYSILHGRVFRLAPFYDIASNIPFADGERLRQAMKLAGRNNIHELAIRHVRALARDVGVNEDHLCRGFHLHGAATSGRHARRNNESP